jgi:hypothetical protein
MINKTLETLLLHWHHNFHVRKEYHALHHPKPDLATLDGTTATINTFFSQGFFYLPSKLPTLCAQPTYDMATMAPPPPSTKSWQNMTRTRET